MEESLSGEKIMGPSMGTQGGEKGDHAKIRLAEQDTEEELAFPSHITSKGKPRQSLPQKKKKKKEQHVE